MANRFSTGKMMNTGKMMKAVSGQHFSQLNILGLPKQHSAPIPSFLLLQPISKMALILFWLAARKPAASSS
jgi:hypothetical protein